MSITPPPPGRNKRREHQPSNIVQLTKRQKKAIAVAEKKEQDLNRIKEAI